MMFNKATLFTAVAALSKLAFAEDTPDGQTKVHVVQVGDMQGSLKFYPEELTALPGEMVQFHFYPRNHSVVQSSFEDPCVPISESSSANGEEGFFSGFMPVSEDSELMPTFTIPIEDDKPIWYYCATGAHCQNGMVGVINPPKNNSQRTLALYKEAAADSQSSAPDEEFGGEEGTAAPNATTTATATGTAPTETETETAPPDSDGAASTLSASLTVMLGTVAVAFFLA